MASSSPKLTSDLCKPLPSILTDTSSVSMLDYFIQFMEKEKAIHLVQFWLSVEAFKSTPHSNCQEGATKSIKCNGAPSNGSATILSTVNTLSETTDAGLSHMTVTRLGEDDQTIATVAGDVLTSHGDVLSVDQSLSLQSKQGNLSVATDAMEIYSTYIALNALTPVGLPADIRQQIEVNICPEDGVIDRQCFEEAQHFIYQTMETSYYPAFLRSSFLCKYQLEYISSDHLCLLDFLLADNALFYFMEFMEQEGASSLVQFWLMANNFQRHLSDSCHVSDIDLDTRDAIAIYDRFFSLQATHPLLMGDSVRIDIENKICSEQGPRPDSFALTQDRAYQSMNQTFYPSFLRSSIYLRFLNELVHMLNASTSRKPEEKHKQKAAESRAVLEWKEDLDDPDTLWRRPRLPMRLGFVDQFGQYTSEVECVLKDTTAKAGRFTWVIRNRQQEEELTMKIAVNIVSEVMGCVKRGDKSNISSS